jgi:hypothetical protein
MRKQGDNAASIPKRPTSSPGLRLGACMRMAIPRLAPGGLDLRMATPGVSFMLGMKEPRPLLPHGRSIVRYAAPAAMLIPTRIAIRSITP